ncbi:MAG: hypothetical protein LBS03_01950 [Bacteroidales bacterium]|jgi:hypothetical protein|nr:hypothetical protein [Bacteroidales bacterium]
MKRVKQLLSSLAVLAFVACSGDSEEELIGNWVGTETGDFGGVARAYAATFVIDNKGYVCGGDNGYKVPRRDMWVVTVTKDSYGVSAWSWTNTKDSLGLGKGRQRAVGFSVNGKGYVGTGWDGDEGVMKDFWEYDPAKSGQPDAWREIAPLPGVARYDATAFVLKGEAYVTGGYTKGADKEYLQDLWKFTPPSVAHPDGEWTEISVTPSKKRGLAVTFVIGDWVYLCTGKNASGYVSEFQRFNGTRWENLRPIKSFDEDNDYDDEYGQKLLRTNAIGFAMKGSGTTEKGYITAGSTNTTWEYEPPVYEGNRLVSGDIWIQRTSFFTRHGAFALSFPGYSDNNDNLVLIGTGQSGNYYEDLWVFRPEDENKTNDDLVN